MIIDEREIAMKRRSHPAAAAGSTSAFTISSAPAAAKIGFGMSSPSAYADGTLRRSTTESHRGVAAGAGGRRRRHSPIASNTTPVASLAQATPVDADSGVATVKCPKLAAQTA